MKSLLFALNVLVFAGYVEAAEGVQWRSDYAQAVQEAAAAKKPLLLDFGNEGCVYCRKLDATTFRDPAVIRLLNEQFVAIKIDGDHNPKLVQTMRIESYPTLVVTGPDGAMLATHPGYLNASDMAKFLQAAQGQMSRLPERIASRATPDKDGPSVLLQQAKKDLQDGFYLCCVERCDRLIRLHPASAERDQARQIAENATSASGAEVQELISALRRKR